MLRVKMQMMKKRLLATCLLALALSGPVLAGGFATGTFDLYGEPRHRPDPFCDHGTRLVLDKAAVSGNVAFLENFLRGACEIFVPPNPRHYKITSVTPDGCGSMVYKGQVHGGGGLQEIEIIDHRTRVCEDIVPARIVVKEKGPDGHRTLYSHDR
jgi:hypothetical protein